MFSGLHLFPARSSNMSSPASCCYTAPLCSFCSRTAFQPRQAKTRDALRRGHLCLNMAQKLEDVHKIAATAPSLVSSKSSTLSNVEVTRHEARMVIPAPAGGINVTSTTSTMTDCFLSNIDIVAIPVPVRMAFFFTGDANFTCRNNGDHDPAKVLKEALQQVLVHYYPVAGRLAMDSTHKLHGRPFINCTHGELGVSFVEADANVDIAALGDLNLLDPLTLPPQLVYEIPAVDNPPLLTVQVTRFKCGGFVLGLLFRHCIFDGIGLSHFCNAWADIARGIPLSSSPVLDRTIATARSPLQVNCSHSEYEVLDDPCILPTDLAHITFRSFCFTSSSLNILRKKMMEEGGVSKCTGFEAILGLIWKVRTMAMHGKPEQQAKFLLPCDARMVKGAGFPRRYMGNALLLTSATTSVGEMEGKPASYAVKQVQTAMQRATGEYMRSQIDFLEREGAQLPALAGTLSITSWARLGLYNMDFGWGKVMYLLPVFPIMLPDMSIFLAHGEDRKGINVRLCHSSQVLDEMEELLHHFQDPTNC